MPTEVPAEIAFQILQDLKVSGSPGDSWPGAFHSGSAGPPQGCCCTPPAVHSPAASPAVPEQFEDPTLHADSLACSSRMYTNCAGRTLNLPGRVVHHVSMACCICHLHSRPFPTCRWHMQQVTLTKHTTIPGKLQALPPQLFVLLEQASESAPASLSKMQYVSVSARI